MKLYGIGCLIDSLNIKAQELANYVNVDRSLVSKWKSGARKLDIKASYFNKVIEFFLLKNHEIGLKTLESIIGLDKDVDEKHLATELKNFIFSNKTSNIHHHFANNDLSCSYIASVPVYTGDSAKLASILNLLEVAKYTEPCKLIFVYGSVLELIIKDKVFLKQYLSKLLNLLNKGFTLEFLFSSYNSTQVFLYFSSILIHPNSVFYEFTENTSSFSIHILENTLAIWGIREHSQNILFDNNSINPYNFSYTFNDPISISSYTSIASNIKKSSTQLFKNIGKQDIIMNKLKNNIYLNNNNLYYSNSFIYLYNKYPIFTLMNEELFIEVLEASYINHETRKEIFEIYKTRRESLSHQLKKCQIIHFYSFLGISEMLKDKVITVGLNDCLIYPKLKLTYSQAKNFLNDIADLLEKEPNFHICLNSHKEPNSHYHTHGWYLLNNELCAFNTSKKPSYCYSINTSFIQSMISMLQQKYICAPQEERDNILVANLLRKLK